MPAHPAAALFPMISDKEIEELAVDIATRGLLDPIVTYESQILDGRNRLKACRLAKVTPTSVEWQPAPGESPSAFVMAKNILRRHLTASSRAAVAVELEVILSAEAKQRAVEGAKAGGLATAAKRAAGLFSNPAPDLPVANRAGRPVPAAVFTPNIDAEPASVPKRSREIAAQALHVSSGYVGDAKNLKKASEELFEKIKNGEMSLPAAQREAVNRAVLEGILERSVIRPGVKAKIDKPRRTIKPVKKFGKVQSSRVTVVLTVAFGSPQAAEDVIFGLENDKRVLEFAHKVTS